MDTSKQIAVQYEAPLFEKRIMQFVALQDEPIKSALIVRNVKGRRKKILKNLEMLTQTKILERSGSGAKGDPYFYRLNKQKSSTQVYVESSVKALAEYWEYSI